MATTHRPNVRGFVPDYGFQFVIRVLEASEALTAHHQPITPHTLAHRVHVRQPGMALTPPQIQDALVQIQHWRDQTLTRAILDQRREINALGARLRAQQQQLDEDQRYVDKMLEETIRQLHDSLTPPCGTEPPAGQPDTGERRALP